jgi:lipoprotein-anchoring transpeptidase ErfK/SrfK
VDKFGAILIQGMAGMSKTRRFAGLTAIGCLLTGCMIEDMQVVQAPSDATIVEVAAAPQEAEPAPAELALAEPEPVVIPPWYAARADGERTVPAIDVGKFHDGLLRSQVDYVTTEAPGTIVIDTTGPFLYFVEPEGKATRYGIAVGREGFGWTGAGTIARFARWPRWTPPPEMIERDPSLEKWRGGQPGGLSNPLGARALYIYFGDQDSGYRIHGTNQPNSIGRAASSGCFRMLNQDVIDLYDRVQKGAKVVVI